MQFQQLPHVPDPPADDADRDLGADDAPVSRAVHLDLSRCWSCGRTGIPAPDCSIGVLVVLTSPAGPYALCPACLGRDAEPRTMLTATRVVHVKRDGLAIAVAAAAGFYVYVGRPSRWGNPFTHKADTLGDVVVPLPEVLPRYEDWLRQQPELMTALAELRGKVLGCWCKPKPCHGDVLARLADGDRAVPAASSSPSTRRASSGAR